MQNSRWSAALLVLAAAAYGAPAEAGPITFIQDDFARARAEARTRKLPLFVEVWAPW